MERLPDDIDHLPVYGKGGDEGWEGREMKLRRSIADRETGQGREDWQDLEVERRYWQYYWQPI